MQQNPCEIRPNECEMRPPPPPLPAPQPLHPLPSDSNKAFQCQQCLKSFTSKHQLNQHIRVHTKEKPYKCTFCSCTFKQLSHVQQHTRRHTGERPYKCPMFECSRAFIQWSNLQQHLKNHDIQMERDKNKPYVCNACGKHFATDSSLRTHSANQHQFNLANISHKCPVCSERFIDQEALIDHIHVMHKDDNLQSSHGINSNPWSRKESIKQKVTKRREKFSRKMNNDELTMPIKTEKQREFFNSLLALEFPDNIATTIKAETLEALKVVKSQYNFKYYTDLFHRMEAMQMDPNHQFAPQYFPSKPVTGRHKSSNNHSSSVASASGSGIAFPTSSITTVNNSQTLTILQPAIPHPAHTGIMQQPFPPVSQQPPHCQQPL